MSTIVPQVFWAGNPNDGTAVSNSLFDVQVTEVSAPVPPYKRWIITYITVTNMTQVRGYFSVAIFPEFDPNNPTQKITTMTPQPFMGALNTHIPLAQSIAGGPGYRVLGKYLAYSEPIPPATSRTFPQWSWAAGGSKLWAGAYPGYNAFLGAGGIHLEIGGRELRG